MKLAFLVLMGLPLLSLPLFVVAQESLDPRLRDDVARALVQIQIDEQTSITGIVVSSAGFIFTFEDEVLEGEEFDVAVFTGIDSPPSVAYRANTIFASEDVNFALLQITGDARGQQVFSDELELDHIFRWSRQSITTRGEQVYTFAYGEQGELSIETGEVIGSIDDGIRGESLVDSNFYYQTNRGGAVVNENGAVIGLITGNQDADAGNVNFTRVLSLQAICETHASICDSLLSTTPALSRSTRRAVVCLADGIALEMRDDASINGTSVQRVQLGDHVVILDEPSVRADGYSWVQVQMVDGNTGWLPDIFNRSRTLLNYRSDTQIEQRYPIQAGYGAMICAAYPHEDLTLRSTPEGNIIKRLRSGLTVEIVSGPLTRSSGSWWQVIDTEGTPGWIAQADGETRSLLGMPE
jgi:hypothetical protein